MKLTIIDRYIIRKFLGTFFFAISLLIIIVIIFDISEKIDDFITKQAPLQAIIFDYYLNFIPFFINLFSNLFTFIAVVFFTSRLAARTEIVAMLSGGISFRRLLRPYMISASFLVILTLYLSNFLIPHTNITLREFEKKYLKNPPKSNVMNLHLQIEPGVFVYYESWDNKEKTGYRFTLEKFQDSLMVYKLLSDRIKWDSTAGKWRLEQYVERQMQDTSLHRLVFGAMKDTTLNLLPDEIMVDKEDIKIMNFSELNAFIAREKLKGSSMVRFYETEKQKRIAVPVSALILTLIGLSLSSRKVRGGTGMHLGLGIGITFSYILFMQISTQFSVYGSMSPLLATWLPNMLFFVVGMYLFMKAPK
ncbi:MAG: lipopolysaccharide export system permease protein [Bacteroidales bacterium]|jgi:lipopolysaccharide export system permease protein|nr:lipopolysaccharide export system permease protein [Bacteroidales bacterium]MDN5329930.1 lipopolysaccharide export system permease protein [Bacteroidales bacterium]